ncbi:hypothetical protein [Methanomassiliicoccus luminyensis]|uniref:hypothetical protein n=1 Tax=Methanomassiliicoccus luminyensis TaxID=1080712 RepID=UPI0011CC004B|nr:hypothetical protein [Methanomassiliicoccus luminyensis]
MRRDRRGMAAMFDAVMFLAVASVVSVALLGVFSAVDAPQDPAVMERVEAAHQVLLRSTLSSSTGNNLTVMEMAATEVMYGTSQSSLDMASEALPTLIPGMEFRWEAWCGERSMTTSPASLPGGSDVYCSMADVDMPWGKVTFRLRAWFA